VSEDVAATAADQGVLATDGAHDQPVITIASFQSVAAPFAVEAVMAAAADQQILAIPAVQKIFPGFSPERVVVAESDDLIVPGRAAQEAVLEHLPGPDLAGLETQRADR